MVLYLKSLDQVLVREVVLMEAVNRFFMSLQLPWVFDAEAVGQVSKARDQVRAMLDDGVTEVKIL